MTGEAAGAFGQPATALGRRQSRPEHEVRGDAGDHYNTDQDCEHDPHGGSREHARFREVADTAHMVEVAVRHEDVDRTAALARRHRERLDLLRGKARVAEECLVARARKQRVRLPERRLEDTHTVAEVAESAHGRRR